MLEKIANSTTLRNLTGLSRLLIRKPVGSISAGRFCSSRPVAPVCSKTCWKNVSSPSSLLSSRILNGNNLIISRSHGTGNHVNLWKLERIVAAAFVPLFPLCLMMDSAALDGLLALLSVIHVHWGLEAIIVDYARPIVVGHVVPKVLFVSLYLVSALTLAGLLVLVYNGPGITKVLKQGWAIGKDNK